MHIFPAIFNIKSHIFPIFFSMSLRIFPASHIYPSLFDPLSQTTFWEAFLYSVTLKHILFPLSLCTDAFPPCVSAIARTMDSPIPVPPVAEERDSSMR